MCRVCDYTRGRDREGLLSAIHSETKVAGIEAAVDFIGNKDDPLSLAEGAEQASFERAGPEIHLAPVVVSNDDANPGGGVVGLDHTLHR